MGQTREVVVITGASAGVGRATVRRFAREGCAIGLIARGQAGLEAAQREVAVLGGHSLVLPCDVAEADEVERAAERVENELGPIDVWINCATVTVFAELVDVTPEEFRRITEVTYLGSVYGTMAALKRMVPRDRGTIVQVGSALAYRGIPLQSAYCGAKHAIRGFTNAVRTELLHRKSRVHLGQVHLPAVNTPQFSWSRNKMPHEARPVPPIYQPEVPAEAIYFAAHHRRRAIWVGGSTAVVITGNKFLPGVGDWYLGKTGYESQQYDGAPDPTRRDNLFQPLDDVLDHGAHGSFDDRAHGHSIELWAAKKRPLLLATVAALGLASVATLLVLRSA
jgi:NAD(P)-dependent dehydrogenase (short-subunit alcohol dehydrogenase family)